MKIGKLDVKKADHKVLGFMYLIKVANMDLYYEDADGNLVLKVSPQTAKKLAKYFSKKEKVKKR